MFEIQFDSSVETFKKIHFWHWSEVYKYLLFWLYYSTWKMKSGKIMVWSLYWIKSWKIKSLKYLVLRIVNFIGNWTISEGKTNLTLCLIKTNKHWSWINLYWTFHHWFYNRHIGIFRSHQEDNSKKETTALFVDLHLHWD